MRTRRGICVILIFSLLLCSVLDILPQKAAAEESEESVITMTDFYESGASIARDLVITIESKEELVLLRKYVGEGKSTVRGTFRLIQDIYWSDYSFEYNETYDRFGIYYNGQLVKAFDQKTRLYYPDYLSSEGGEKDLNLQGESWKVIGTREIPMRGDFDGNGHTIHGLWEEHVWSEYLTEPYTEHIPGGLFYETYGNITDLTIKNFYISDCPSPDFSFGVLCNYAKDNLIKNCNIEKAFFDITNTDYNISGLGGAVGWGQEITISDCNVEFFVSGSGPYVNSSDSLDGCVGGVAGRILSTKDSFLSNNTAKGRIWGAYEGMGGILGNYDSGGMLHISDCISHVLPEGTCRYAGGIAGRADEMGEIERCENYGDINVSASSGVGGVVGGFRSDYGSHESVISVRECRNYGNITGYGKCGGIFGLYNQLGTLKLYDCSNQGNIHSAFEGITEDEKIIATGAGGILGGTEQYNLEENPYQVVNSTEIRNCANQGDVSAGYDYSGGIIGHDNSEKIMIDVSNCYSIGSVTVDKGVCGALAGALTAGKISDCYYMGDSDCAAIGEKGEMTEAVTADLYPVTESQVLGTEQKVRIGASGYAAVCTLCEALNRWVIENREGEDGGWENAEAGPVWNSGLKLPRPTPVPTATPTGEPTATPTGKPTATPTLRPTVTPTRKPTATPTLRPTVKPTRKPTAAPTIRPTVTPTVAPALQASDGESRLTAKRSPDPAAKQDLKSSKRKKMKRATFSVRKKRTAGGRRYVQITLKKYSGTHLEIWVKHKRRDKFYKLKIKNNRIRKKKKVFNLQYRKQKGTLVFRLRTYKKSGKRKIYSYYSKKKKVKL